MRQAASLFNQLLQHFPRTEFGALVKKHNAERAAKGFTCWTQFVSMIFCQLGRADSLREICSKNASRIQIWTALIALLLLIWLHHFSKANWSLFNLASMLRLQLFTYRKLTKWLNDPLETPPLISQPEQLALTWD